MQKSSIIDRHCYHRHKVKVVRRDHREGYSLEIDRARNRVIAVDVAEITVLYAEGMKYIYNFTADKRIENGREVEVAENRESPVFAQTCSFGQTDLETRRLSQNDFLVIDLVRRVLQPLLNIPAAASADHIILDEKSVVVKKIDRSDPVFREIGTHLRDGGPPEIVISFSEDFFPRKIVYEAETGRLFIIKF